MLQEAVVHDEVFHSVTEAEGVMQVKAALQLWDGSGCFVYTGSAGIYSAEDGSEVREESPSSPPGKDERTDRCPFLLSLAALPSVEGGHAN